MKWTQYRTIGLAVLVAFGSTSALQAVYTEIQNNAYDGVKDFDYDGTHVSYFTSDSEGQGYNVLTLKDDYVPEGQLDNYGIAYGVTLSLTAAFQDFDSTVPGKAYFAGQGTVDVLQLDFTYYDYGTGLSTAHTLRGVVTEGTLEVTAASASTSTVVGIFQFNTNYPVEGIENLPGSGIWPATGNSSAVNLTFAINTDLSAYMTDAAAWNDPMPGENVYDTQFSLLPEEIPIPEPGALLLGLFGIGGFVMMRPRRKES